MRVRVPIRKTFAEGTLTTNPHSPFPLECPYTHHPSTPMTVERRHVGKRLSELVVHRPSGLCWLAGVVAEDAKADLERQARSVLAQIDRLLAEAGSDKSKIVSATIYLPDIGDFAAMNAVWEAWVPAGQTPARATVEAKLARSDLKIEIQVVASL